MPAIATIEVYPGDASDRSSVEVSIIMEASKAHRRPVASEWSFLEAVTWIATRNLEMVNGLAPYQVEVAEPAARQCELQEPMGAETIVAGILVNAIAKGFCQCKRNVAWPGCVYDWNQLSAAEQAVAASDSRAPNSSLYRSAHARNCTCFDAAARTLFASAATGQVVAQVRPERKNISRLEWLQADYDLMNGLWLGARRMELVSFRSAAIRKIWPGSVGQEGKTRGAGRPKGNVEPVTDAFRERRDQGVSLERSLRQETLRCIEIAKGRGERDLPKLDTCCRHLREHYQAASNAEK
jgi:hypothetical protein